MGGGKPLNSINGLSVNSNATGNCNGSGVPTIFSIVHHFLPGPKSTCTYRKYPLVYYHMCRFFNYLFFQSATLRQFNYVWRMDGNIALSRCEHFPQASIWFAPFSLRLDLKCKMERRCLVGCELECTRWFAPMKAFQNCKRFK